MPNTSEPVGSDPENLTPTPSVVSEPSSQDSGKLRAILFCFISLLLIGGAYWLGSSKNSEKEDATETSATVLLPKEATVTAECADMRGIQYILPEDIPDGPIYDVHDGKVIAVEYLVSETELTASPDMFEDLGLFSGTYDHLSIIPTAAHAGLNETHFHAVAYLISHDEAHKITCGEDDSAEHGH